MTFRAPPEARDWVRTIPGSYGGGLRALLALRERTPFAEQDLARIAPADVLTQRRIQASARAEGDHRFTMRDAITESGYRNVHCVAVACLVADALGEVAPQGPFQASWYRAAERGILAIFAASTQRAHVDSAFTAGFVFEIGDLLCEMYEATQRHSANEAAPESLPASANGDLASTDLAVALAERWRLPPEILEAVGGPPAEDGEPSILGLIETADRVMARLVAGEPASERPEDGIVMQRLEAMGGREWLDRSAQRLIDLAFVDDRLTKVA